MNRLKSPKVLFLIFLVVGFIIYIVTKSNSIEEAVNLNPAQKEHSNIEFISTDFNQNTFTDGNELKLLKELKLCDTTILAGQLGSCSPKFFRFFKLNNHVSLRKAFLLLVNGAAYPTDPEKFKSRRILVFERENGQLVLTNTIKGNLIELRKNGPSTYDDLVIRFRLDEYDEAYHCLFKWKDGTYAFDSCEELFSFNNKGKVKQELKDSVSIEVKKILYDEKLLP